MCGLTGIFTKKLSSAEHLLAAVNAMSSAIAHRGPDDDGAFVVPDAGLALGFRRLAIIDLSAAGHQPMTSESGRYTMVFNGEVYNYRQMRQELEQAGGRFQGSSDSTVILSAFEHWGIAESVRRFVGMFAIAVWDAELRALTLIRDRLGIKPMFVSSVGGTVLFGSELKALAAHPEFERKLDLTSVAAYLRLLYVPSPRTIFQSVVKLPPGHLLTIQDPAQALPAPQRFWSVEEVAQHGRQHQLNASDAEVVAEFDQVLRDAVALRMQSDVPWGALLSGGIDSSTVVALMQSIATAPVKTFTIGFDSSNFNEAADARAVARVLGTDHTELMLTGADALDVIPRLPEMFDEPLADPSQVPTYLVCQLARQQVTVALTGDGGDELFTGYNRYLQGEGMINGASRLPHSLRQLTAAGMNWLSSSTWDRIEGRISSPGGQRPLGEKIHKMGKLMQAGEPADMYLSLLSAIHHPEDVVAQGREPSYEITRIMETADGLPLMERMMLADQMTYLADDLLAKVDRASMAVSLEARVPLLDHRVVEFAWRLPRRFRVRDGKGKWILREVLHQMVPRELVDRPKMGFSVPIAEWIAGPLRPWAEELLQPARLERNGALNVAGVRRQWDAFTRSPGANASGLWAILMLQAWQDHWNVSAP